MVLVGEEGSYGVGQTFHDHAEIYKNFAQKQMKNT
jgi:hypothetical protein